MRIFRVIFKILALPLMLFLAIVRVLFNLCANLSCYVLGPLMLFILGCGIYTIVKQLWSQTFLLALMEAGCLLFLFGAGYVIVLLEDWGRSLGEFIHS